jgi:nanoRNase/pAp phosphatase (c-di-AMP/oligoRNAs hydrolase)
LEEQCPWFRTKNQVELQSCSTNSRSTWQEYVMEKHLESLLKAVEGAERLLILSHNDPDPDAIASALALRYLVQQRLGIQGEAVYKGIVGRAENKALMRYLEYPLRRLICFDPDPGVPIALVDTQPGAGNNALPPGWQPAIVLDHHPLREGTAKAIFADVRTHLGATSTLLTQYLQAADLELPQVLATALFYGVKTDTMGLSRGTCPSDVAAYFYLQPQVDYQALARVERAEVPPDYFRSLVATLQAARRYDHVLISYMGWMSYPGLAAEMADLLLRLEDIRCVMCMGAHEEELILSVRTVGGAIGAERLVQAVVQERGTAGGHGTMAGGQVPLRDQSPESLALLLGRLALEQLGVAPIVEGRPLV